MSIGFRGNPGVASIAGEERRETTVANIRSICNPTAKKFSVVLAALSAERSPRDSETDTGIEGPGPFADRNQRMRWTSDS